MMEVLSLDQMRANVALSRGHIIKQTQIIQRLIAQGHSELAAQASTILVNMDGHLANEIVMLDRMEANVGQKR